MNTQQQTARPAVGALLYPPGHGRCEVVSNSDPSTVTLRTAQGTELRIGERALQLALIAADGDARPASCARC